VSRHASPGALFSCLLFLLVSAAVTRAQEMEPGAYSRAPVGTNFVLVAYAYQEGDVLLDAALPLRDVSVKLHSGSIGYGRTFGLIGRQANVAFFMPYVHGKASGTVFEDNVEARRSGLADFRARFAMNIIGSPAMKPQEFAKAPRKTTIGASVTVIAPSGQYDPNRLVNLGSNRWSFKPEIGLSKPAGRWTFEVAGGAWLYTTNKDFFGGVRRSQGALLSLQGHVLYTFRPRMWLAGGGTYFRGGRTRVNGVLNDDSRNNSRYGATFSYPLTKSQSLKFAFSRGLTARFGGSLTSIGVAWQYAWF
jgi:hypothetical protein